MKKFKRWLALILAVVLVGSNALYSMSSALKANEIDAAQEASAQAVSEPAPQEPESNNEGVDVSVVDQGGTTTAQEPVHQPVQQEPAQQPGQSTEPSASVTSPEENSAEQPQEETKYDVVIHKPEADGGVVKVWTTGDKKTVSYDGNNIYKEEVAKDTTYNFEITANDGYEVEKVTDKNGTVISPRNVNDNVYTYSLTGVAEDRELSILYKEVKKEEADKKSKQEEKKKEKDEKDSVDASSLSLKDSEPPVPVKIHFNDSSVEEERTIKAGKVNAPEIEGYEFTEARVGSFPLNYLGWYDGALYFAVLEEGADGLDEPATKVEENESVVLYYDKSIKKYNIQAETDNGGNGLNKIVDCPTAVKEGSDFAIKLNTERGYDVTVMVNDIVISAEEANIYKVSAEQAVPAEGDTIHVSVSYKKATNYFAWVDNINLQNWNGAAWSGSIGRSEAQKSSFNPGEAFTFNVKTARGNQNYDWRLNSFQINGEDVNVPTSFEVGASALTTLSTGTTVLIKLTEKTPSYYYDKYQYTYDVTVSNAYENIVVTKGNFRASTWSEIMPQTIQGVELEAYKANNSPGWTTAPLSRPIQYSGQLDHGTRIQFRYRVIPGYGDIEVTTTGGTNTKPSLDKDGYYYFDVKKGNDALTVLKITATIQTYNAIYDKGDVDNADGIPSDDTGYSIAAEGKKKIYVPTVVPTAEGKVFQGWELKGDKESLYEPGSIIDLLDVIDYADKSNKIKLMAVWASEEKSEKAAYDIEYYYETEDGEYVKKGEDTQTKLGYINQSVVLLNTKSAEGYTLNTEKSKRGTTVQREDTPPIQFYFDIADYRIAYNLDGGTVDGENPETYTVHSKDITLINPEKDGYVFKGWSGTELEGNDNKTVTIKSGSTGDREYTAHWEASKAKVSVWFYTGEESSDAYVVTYEGTLSKDGAADRYVKEINSENQSGYSEDEIRDFAETAYNITPEFDRYESHAIYVIHKTSKNWETIENWESYVIQDGDEIRYYVTPELAHKLTYVAGEHSSGESYVDGHYYKGESADVKTFNATGLVADTGYKFDHWENEAGETVSGTYKMGTKDATLKAVCVKDKQSTHKLKYTVEYYKDGVLVSDDTREIERDVWINDDVIPVLEGDIDTSETRYPGYHFTETDPKKIGETVKAGTTIKVYYKANTDTAYTVERYYQTNGSYREAPDETISDDTTKGTTGQLVDTLAFRNPDKEGYVYDADAPGNIETGVVLGDGSLVLKVYFKQQFSVTYKPGEHGTFDDKTFSGLDYNADTPSFTPEGEAGYEFTGWSPAFSDKVTSSVEYVAQWKAREDTEYTVEYYYQSEGTYPETPDLIRKGSGTTGGTAAITEEDKQPSIDGYVYDAANTNNVTKGTINGEGSLVLKVYFKQQFSVTYKPGTQGTFDVQSFDKLDYGTTTPPYVGEPTGNPGYTFDGWGEVAEHVTDNAEYVAQWKANTNTAYTVEHYQEQLSGEYTLFEKEATLAGTTGEIATANAKTYTGFYHDSDVSGTIESGTIAGDGSLVLKLFYTREEHTVTYFVDGKQYGEVENYKYGESINPMREEPVKEGYSFSGWDRTLPEVMGTEALEVKGTFEIQSYNVTYVLDGVQYGAPETYEYNSDVTVRPAPEVPAGYHFSGWSQKEDFQMPAGDVEITGRTLANDDTKYRVEHYKENVDGTFTLAEGRDETGTTGVTVTEGAKEYEGFSYDPVAGEAPLKSGTIAGDGSLTLRLYYTRNSYDVTYKVDGAAYEGAESYRYGEQVSIKAEPVKDGYTFSGWSIPEAFEMPAHNVEITGTFTANGDTKYTVEHHLEGLDGKYTVGQTEDLTGETDTQATANPKTFPGFTYDEGSKKNVTEGTVTGDGKLVLKLYYARDEHTVTYLVDGEQHGEIETYKYGQDIDPLRDRPEKEGYTFKGWNGTLPDKMGTEDITITGTFTINSYNVTYVLDGVQYGAPETYEYNSDVTVRPAPEVPAGYHFSGWSQKEDFQMPAGNVKIEGSTIANTDTEYKVEHYLEGLNGTYREPEETETFTKTTDTVGTAEPNTYEGFTYDPTVEGTLVSGTVAGDGSLVLKLYYTRNSHKVTYSYIGTIPAGASTLPEEATYKYGAEVGIAEAAAAPGYRFSGWSMTEAFTMPDEDVEISGTFTANGDTKYTVEHHLEGLDGKYTAELTEDLTGETDTLATANPKTFTGFTYDEDSKKNVTEGTVTGDGKLVLKLYYARDEHTVTYLVDGEQHGEIETYKYGQDIDPLRDRPEKEGYTFKGWNGTLPDKMGTEDITITGTFTINSYNVTYVLDGVQYGAPETYEYNSVVTVRPAPEVPAGYHFSGWSQKEDFQMPASNVTIEGSMIANPDTEYKVEHYLEGLDGTYGAPEETETFTKTTDTVVTAEPNTYEGFTYDSTVEGTLVSGTVAGDGSLVLKLYYTRNSHKVTYSYIGTIPAGASTLPEEATYKYGAEVGIAEAAAAPGYRFSGWSMTEAFTMPDEDVEISGTFTADGDTKYTVEHHLEGLDGKYTVGLSENLTGETDTLATANRKTFTGFTYDEDSEKNVTEGTITGDGKLVLKLYYARDEHTVTYLVDGEQHGEIETYKYGQDIDPLRDRPEKEGYTFKGWNGTLPDKMGTEDITITGTFTINSYNVTYVLDGVQYGAPETYEYNSDVTVRPAPEVPAGYHFSGWSQKEDFQMPAGDVEITGRTLANDDTKYRVEHYKENVDGTFTLAEGRDETGTTGVTVTEGAKEYEGFSYDPVAGEAPLKSGTIAGDGSLTLRLYYTRNSYDVTYKVDGAAYEGAESYRYGEQVSIKAEPVKDGYTFSGWSIPEAFEMPAHNVEITGTFTANGDTKYTVEHHLEGLDGKYTVGQTEDLTGETDTQATANPKTFPGFTYDEGSKKNVTEGTVTGDGKLVLKLYYARDEHTVTYLVDGEQHGEIETYKYGQDIDPLRDRPEKEGYTFKGWNGTLPEQMGTEDIVISGTFAINSYNVTYLIDGEPYGASESHEYNSKVTLRDQPVKEGYTFSGWQHPDNFMMPAKDVVINGSFRINSYRYTVNYFYDNNLADDETVNDSAQFDSTVKADAPDTKERDGKNYMLADRSMAYETTISTNEDMNVINVYYVLDNNGPGGTPDGIPDTEEYGIVYNANAQNATGDTVDDAIYPVDYQVTLKENGFSNNGYVFDGWSNDADSQNVYEPGGWIRMAEGGLVMNARWSAAPVTPGGTTPDGTNPGGTTPGGDGTTTPANAGPITPATVIQTITEPIAAFAQNVGDAIGANVQQLVQSDDEGVPLANRASKDHDCCILHFLLLLLALLVEIGYTRSMKKRQERIFELREEIAMADKEIDKDEAA